MDGETGVKKWLCVPNQAAEEAIWASVSDLPLGRDRGKEGDTTSLMRTLLDAIQGGARRPIFYTQGVFAVPHRMVQFCVKRPSEFLMA